MTSNIGWLVECVATNNPNCSGRKRSKHALGWTENQKKRTRATSTLVRRLLLLCCWVSKLIRLKVDENKTHTNTQLWHTHIYTYTLTMWWISCAGRKLPTMSYRWVFCLYVSRACVIPISTMSSQLAPHNSHMLNARTHGTCSRFSIDRCCFVSDLSALIHSSITHSHTEQRLRQETTTTREQREKRNRKL